MNTFIHLEEQDSTMDVEALKDLIPLFIAGLTTLGGAVAWLLTRIDSKNLKEREFAQTERAKLEKLFSDQIEQLQQDLYNQTTEIIQLRRELNMYVRHVGVLEGLLKAKGVEPPPFTIA